MEPIKKETVKSEVERLFDIERDLEQKRAAKLEGLVSLETEAGQSVADGGTLESAARSIIEGQAEVRIIDHSIRITRGRRRAAIKAGFEAEAAGLRSAATAKRAEGYEILRRRESALIKLRALEGVAADAQPVWLPLFVDSTPKLQAMSERSNDRPEEADRILAQAATFAAANPKPNLTAPLLVPLSERLMAEAASLDVQARELDAREVQDRAVIQFKTSAAELLASEELNDPYKLAPTTRSISDWLTALENKVPVEQRELRRRYRLSWLAGEIVADDSSVSFHGANSAFTELTYTASVPQS